MSETKSSGHWPRFMSLSLGLVLAAAALLLVTQSLRANEVAPQLVWDAAQANLEGSSKSVSHAEALTGTILTYHVVISNSGTAGVLGVMMTDTLPTSVSYIPDSLSGPGGVSNYEDGVVTWTGHLDSGNSATISFQAQIADSLTVGDIVTNTAEISGTGALLLRWAATTIITDTGPITHTVFLPIVRKSLPPVTLHPVSRPNANNQWLVSWSLPDGLITGFQLQESQTPDFATITNQVNIGPSTTAVQVSHAPSYHNEYYYRIRATGEGQVGPWSAVQRVVTAFYDDFTNPDNLWPVRRTTYFEKVQVNHQDNQLMLRVDDRWDWGIYSPLKEAPTMPYAIEYQARNYHLANLTSHGAIFGGDWDGVAPCFDPSSYDTIYKHEDCFNHFYNTNTIWFSGLKVLFERVDYLVWCLECGGSPMKRLSHDYSSWFESDIGTRPGVNPSGVNVYRIEVRANGIKLFVNGEQYAETNDTTWIHQPYFGLFASTDEYKPSEWLFDYYSVKPLDN